jgi:poly(A) polymerase/tRNA nucleotidyltransferase (CCA-adding enzyme)
MMQPETNQHQLGDLIASIESALDRDDVDGLREALTALLARPSGAGGLRALDGAGLLTRIIPELEPARATEQPIVHFLPVLAHSIEAVAAVDWLLGQFLARALEHPADQPAAIQVNPDLRYHSVYREKLRAHFAGRVGRYPRAALYKLGALLHDVAKPQTKRPKPGGGVSFHEHQSIGGEVALEVVRRLRFDSAEVGYVRTIVRAHMRPGQLAALGEVTLRAVQRFFHDTGDAGPDVLLFLLADHMATRGPQIDIMAWIWQARWIDTLLDTIWGEAEQVTPPLLNGDDLMRELGVARGPLVGRLLAAVGEAQADERITTREEAIALARRLLREA